MSLTAEVEAFLDKARHALEVAAKLLDGGDFADAAGKGYDLDAVLVEADALLAEELE